MSKMNGKLVGPFGLNNRNRKGRNVLRIFLTNNLKIVNNFLANLIILPGDRLVKYDCRIC